LCKPFLKQKSIYEAPQRLITNLISPQPKYTAEDIDYRAAVAIFVDGRPYGLFDSLGHKCLMEAIAPTWRPPSRQKIASLLPIVYNDYRNQVRRIIDAAESLNVIFDASDDVNGHRILNVSIEIPNSVAFYWSTIDTGDRALTAEATVQLLRPILDDIFGGKGFRRLNAFCTDTNNTMRRTYALLATDDDFKHCFHSLCASHGYQLLVKDLLQLEPWRRIANDTAFLISTFKSSKLQLARLRSEMLQHAGKHRAFIVPVMTRWGTHAAAVKSVLDNEFALLAFTRREDVISDTRLAGATGLRLQKTLTIIANVEYWTYLRRLHLLLTPISEVQDLSEADRSHVGFVIAGWYKILGEWHQLGQAQQFTGVDLHPLQDLLIRRMRKQVTSLHWAAFCLDPKALSTPTDGNDIRLAESFLQRHTPPDLWPAVRAEFIDFRLKSGPIYTPDSDVYNCTEPLHRLWARLVVYGSGLAGIARRIYGALANSVPSERSFSTLNFLHNTRRNRITPEGSDMSAFIYMNSRVLARLEAEKKTLKPLEPAVRWSTIPEDVILQLEDEVVSEEAPTEGTFERALEHFSFADEGPTANLDTQDS
jgi:hypothetical protein